GVEGRFSGGLPRVCACPGSHCTRKQVACLGKLFGATVIALRRAGADGADRPGLPGTVPKGIDMSSSSASGSDRRSFLARVAAA
ncbi:hypothetical protein, partial [Paenibacillus sp. GbtcB18]|uniref:hypothetical protein n=1 Tax=Paenibacillus sp. GbtcB18 TaxID=2824763 RepID=UPI001C308B77